MRLAEDYTTLDATALADLVRQRRTRPPEKRNGFQSKIPLS